MMNRMSRCCSANISGATCARAASRWNLQSGEAALRRIADAAGVSLILILSDINMPGMTGLELLPKAKAARPDVPVIMITAYGDAETEWCRCAFHQTDRFWSAPQRDRYACEGRLIKHCVRN